MDINQYSDSTEDAEQLPQENLQQLEHIIQYENTTDKNYILRPLSAFHVYVNWRYRYDPNKAAARKGLALCHGHNYNNEITTKLKFIKNWYYVDFNRFAYPDYVADITNEYQMNYFPNDYFWVALSIYCPVPRSYSEPDKNNYPFILKNMHRIIKKNGLMCFTELPALFFWFVSDAEFDEIIRKINEIVPKKDLDNFRKEMSEVNDKSFYRGILMSAIHKEMNDDQLHKYVDEISLHYTKRFLEQNNFEYLGKKSMFLFAKPIKK